MMRFFHRVSPFIDPLKPDWRLLSPRLPSILGSYRLPDFRTDVLAAATVAMVSIPQAVGFALIAGLPPAMVLTCVIVGGFVASWFFSSRHIVFGPSNSLSMLLAAAFVAHGSSALGPAELAVVLALMIGIVQVLAGCFRFGQITQFISRSVILGYGSAIGVLLVLSQLHHFIGVEGRRDASLWTAPWQTLRHILAGDTRWTAVAVAVAALLLLVLVKRLRPRWPDALLVLLFFSLYGYVVGWEQLGVKTLGDSGAIFASLPNFSGLTLGLRELSVMRDLLVPAIAIALLGMLDASSIAKTYGMKAGDRIETNRELVAMGFGNLACACFAAMPGSASFARSAANFQAGARTQLSGAMGSLFVLGLLVLLAPLVNHIPVPALAAALVRIGWGIVDLEQIKIASRSTGSDALTLWGTFAAALLLPLDIAVYVGVGLALVLALRKIAAPTLTEYAFDSTEQLSQLQEARTRIHPQIAIIHVEGELFFGASDLLQDDIRLRAERDNLRVIILRLKNARHLDATSVFALRALHSWMRQTDRHLLISGVHGPVLHVMRRSGLLDHLTLANIFPAELNPNIATKKALLRAQELLGTKDADIRIFYDQPAPVAPCPV